MSHVCKHVTLHIRYKYTKMCMRCNTMGLECWYCTCIWYEQIIDCMSGRYGSDESADVTLVFTCCLSQINMTHMSRFWCWISPSSTPCVCEQQTLWTGPSLTLKYCNLMLLLNYMLLNKSVCIGNQKLIFLFPNFLIKSNIVDTQRPR